MEYENLTLDDIIARTLDALIGAGFQYQTVWGQYIRHYTQLSKYCRKHGVNGYDFAAIEAFTKMKEAQYHRDEISRNHYVQICRSMKILTEYASNGILVSTIERKGTRFTLHETFETILQEYLDANTFHPNTQDDVVWAIRRFLFYLEQSNHYSLHCVNESHVRKFLLVMSERLSSGSLKNMMCYLREFSRFVYDKGYTECDMVPLFSIKIRRENKIYPTITDEELDRILAQVDTKNVMAKRDMAMLMLAITTGLRAIDIVNLKLKDIDWLRGEIRLVQKKTLVPVILPLMPQAEDTIQDYILNGRPKCDSEYIFLTVTHPIRKFADDTTFGYMFGKYQRMAGIKRQAFDGRGFHSIRRRIATKMIVSGVPVTTVAQVLGQMKTESVKQYLSFDTENLRQCAVSLDGIEAAEGVWDE